MTSTTTIENDPLKLAEINIILQDHVYENITLYDCYLRCKSLNINPTIKDIFYCTTTEIFDESKLPMLESDIKENEENKKKSGFLAWQQNRVLDTIKTFYATIKYQQIDNSNIITIIDDLKSDEKYSKYLEATQKITLNHIISYKLFKEKEELEEELEEKLENAIYLEKFNKIKQEFADCCNEESLIEFFNKYEITPKMLMDFKEYNLEIEEFENSPFENLDLTAETDEYHNFVDDFFEFMSYNLTYQTIQTYTLIDSINFIAIFEFKNGLKLGSVGELYSDINAGQCGQEYDITLGEFHKLKKKIVELEIWECEK